MLSVTDCTIGKKATFHLWGRNISEVPGCHLLWQKTSQRESQTLLKRVSHGLIAYLSIFRWGTHLYMSLFPSVCLSICLSIWWSVRPSVCLSVCPSIPTSVCLSVCPSVHPSVCLPIHPLYIIFQGLCVMWSLFLVHMCKMMISPGVFFHFIKILIFGSLGE